MVIAARGPKRAAVVLAADEKRARYELRDAEATGAWLFVVIGAAFAIVGLVDLALMWMPIGVGNPAWEFAALSQTFSNVPLTGLALVLVAYGLVRRPQIGGLWIRGAALVFAFLTLVLVVMGFLYLTVVPEILRHTPAEGAEGVLRVVIKNGVEVVFYPVAFGVISFVLWRAVNKTTKSDRTEGE